MTGTPIYDQLIRRQNRKQQRDRLFRNKGWSVGIMYMILAAAVILFNVVVWVVK